MKINRRPPFEVLDLPARYQPWLTGFQIDARTIVWKKVKKAHRLVGIPPSCSPNDQDDRRLRRRRFHRLSELDERRRHWIGRMRVIFAALIAADQDQLRSEEHTSELQSLMRISYAVFCF